MDSYADCTKSRPEHWPEANLALDGGGYGLFGAIYSPSQLMSTNNNGFISVIIQYRLGAFGFLSSASVKENGQVNAGLLDQRFALHWVQTHIQKFGGDPKKVTLAGESAGAGSVMLQAMAYGGKQEVTLFDNVRSYLTYKKILIDASKIIAASVYVAKQYNYNDQVPTQYYEAFTKAAGCNGGTHATDSATFNCLVNADTVVLQNASATVSVSGEFGAWAFLPVTDGDFLQMAPSKQLLEKAVSGKRLLLGVGSAVWLSIILPADKIIEQRKRRCSTDSNNSDCGRLLEIFKHQFSFPRRIR